MNVNDQERLIGIIVDGMVEIAASCVDANERIEARSAFVGALEAVGLNPLKCHDMAQLIVNDRSINGPRR